MRIELTQAQLTQVVSSVLQSLRTNSKAILELTLVNAVNQSDYIELSESKRMAVKTIVDKVIEHFGDGSVSTSMLQDLCVTTVKVADAAITTAKLADESVTLAKLAAEVTGTITSGSTGFVTGDAVYQMFIDTALWERGTGNNSLKQKGGTNAVSGKFSIAEGDQQVVTGKYAHAEGYGNSVSKDYGHAEGYQTVVGGVSGHAEGTGTRASGPNSHAEGENTEATNHAHAEGYGTMAGGKRSHSEGKNTYAGGNDSHAEGDSTKALGNQSHTEGHFTDAGELDSADNSHAEGYASGALGMASHAEGGYGCGSQESRGDRRIAIVLSGSGNAQQFTLENFDDLGIDVSLLPGKKIVYGSDEETDVNVRVTAASVVAGVCTIHTNDVLSASALNSVTFYLAGNTASGVNAHAEGNFNAANGTNSHAEGHLSVAGGANSHTEGEGTMTSQMYEHAQGKYNRTRQWQIHSVGIGTGDGDRVNGEEMDYSGRKYLKGVGGYDGTNGGQSGVRDVAQTINGQSAVMGYGVCDTAASTAVKVVSISNFPSPTAFVGGCFKVKMTYANTAASGVKLLVNGTTAIDLKYNGEAVSDENTWEAGEVLSVYFDGDYFQATNVQGGGGSAEKVGYDNTQSGYQNIDNAQDAIDMNAQLIRELQASVYPLEVTLAVSGSSTREYTGQAQSVNFYYTVKRKGVSVAPSSLTMTVGGVTTTVANPGASGTLTVPSCGKGTTNVSITATYGSLSKSASSSVSFIAPVLVTYGANSAMSAADIEQAQDWYVKNSAAGTYTMSPASDFYFWVCVPSGKTITKVTSSGFDVPMERQVAAPTVTQVNGNSYEEAYTCYRSSAKLVSGSWTFVVS